MEYKLAAILPHGREPFDTEVNSLCHRHLLKTQLRRPHRSASAGLSALAWSPFPRGCSAGVRQNPLLSVVLVCGTGIIVASGSSIGYYAVTQGIFSDREATIGAALDRLDAGEYDQAKDLADRLRKKLGNDYSQLGYPLFVQGAVLAHEASELGPVQERQTLYLVAARYLEEARDRGFPPGRDQEGRYLLATSLFHSGSYAESLRPLLDAASDQQDRAYEIYRLLSIAYLRDTPPDLNRSLTFNRLWLEAPSLTRAELDEAYLRQSEILLGLHDAAACHTALDQIDEDSPLHSEALIIEARLLIQEGDALQGSTGDTAHVTAEGQNKYRQAIDALQRAQSKDLLGVSTRQSRYLLGICHRKLGDVDAASKALERARCMHYRTPEALAATVAEAELAQERGRGDAALELWLKAIEDVGLPSTYQNPWLSWNDLRGRLIAGQRLFQSSKDFVSALALADALERILPADEVTQARAQTEQAWAEQLLATTATQDAATAEVTQAEAHRRFRLAAVEFRKLAQLRFATRHYADDLWESGRCFLRGQNYELAIELLREYLRHAPKKQSPHGLVGLGEAYLALGRFHEAIQALDECIEYFPKHPESYRARILANQAYQEIGELDKAEALLVENLDNSLLEPTSIPWKQSQYERGKLLYRQALIRATEGRLALAEASDPNQRQAGLQQLLAAHDLFQQSIDTLGQAITRHERDTQSLQALFLKDVMHARYCVGEAYRQSADVLSESLRVEPTQSRRNTLTQQMRGYLRESATAHHALQELLIAKQTQDKLSAVEQSMLRNTYFAYADALFDMEAYDEAMTAYAAATNRFQHEPEALEALMQIANCYRRLNAPDEARGTLRQAQAVLSRIRTDADFTKTTRYTQEQWGDVLAWLSQL